MSAGGLNESTTQSAEVSATHSPTEANGAARAFHVVLLLVVGTLWGIQPALIKYAVGTSLSELETLAIVMLAVVAALGAKLWRHDRLIRPGPGLLGFMTVAGVTEYAFPLVVTFLVAPHLDAGLLTLIVASTPVFTVAFAALVKAEPVTPAVVTACLVGMVAMAMIVVPENALPSREMLPWCLAAFSVPVSYSVGTIYVSRNWPLGHDSIQVAFLGSFAAVVMLLPFWLKPIATGAFLAISGAQWAVLALLALTLVVEMMLYFYLVRNAGPVFTSFSSFVMIVSGFVAGMALFGERPSAWIWASVAMFVVSLALVFWPRPQRRTVP